MKKCYIALIVLSALGLVACGSSGGGSSDSSPTQPDKTLPDKTPPSPPQMEEIQESGFQTEAKTIYGSNNKQTTGVFWTVPKHGGNIELTFRASNDPLNNIIIGDKPIELYSENSGASFSHIANGILSNGLRGNYVVNAVVSDEDDDNVYIVEQGSTLTPAIDMPTTGEFQYKGNGLHSYTTNGDVVNKYNVESDVSLTANFADKTLKGTISSADPEKSFDSVQLAAKIRDNYFEGKVNDVKTVGGFYGPAASEIGGIYTKDNAYFGTFVAQKKAQ
ncbi:transferrin-binding protein-like solute binding protein [Lonepinella sp. BR2271]|uniref:transferrin-binding protein-like solute binding protein n=1 Tax=Lonepinella sp. BR2271 TaxID=3434550 RepID=UPI003F6DE617